ncbi:MULTISPECIES: hypothetical protein [Limnospira]|uniref:DUF2281 domain-containing protein n=2 Tax=Limnospira TaxID=2596745 RepID=B5W7D1_LIMMA|nr:MULTISPECIES: hypothetical protein [Limnospira]EDZ92552.1 conserved hypothetical protein [Limnospira maxima CS-328]MDC0840019.1 hypothetical protein [Limnoraphis robusta]MDT9197793.1 hypothetical protein [Limnospira sp. PMC 1042.18]
MSALLKQVLQEIEQLTIEEQLEVISHATEQLKRRTLTQHNPKRSWQELRGIAPNLLNGQDAQEWVNQLRREWDEREKRLFEGP